MASWGMSVAGPACAAGIVLGLVGQGGRPAIAAAPVPTEDLVQVLVLSNRADLISGGDALVQVVLPPSTDPSVARMDVDGRDVTGEFALRGNGKLEGLVTGLSAGVNLLTARLPNGSGAHITITNHPIGGPVFSGPQIQPWICQKSAVDAQCNQPIQYSWLYKSTDPNKELQPYDPAHPASDVAMTRTDQGVTLPFIVRVETGYEDRDQYRIGVLYRPGQPWAPWAPQSQWDHKLLITHGASCGSDFGAYQTPSIIYDGSAGDPSGVPLVDNHFAHSPTVALGLGFAVTSTDLDNNGDDCNLVIQAESLVMVKEHLIETYGELRYTIGTGCSGGSLTQQQVANAYPGIYQGILPQCSFPDTWTSATQVADYHLLNAYFGAPTRWGTGVVWTPTQMAAVEGNALPVDSLVSDRSFFAAANPSAGCWPLAATQRYDPQHNPGGVRCGIADYTVNVFGRRPSSAWGPQEKSLGHGFAGLPLDNVGVQYGLHALEQGAITPLQFVDLNTRIGGLNVDTVATPTRLAADDTALVNAYRSGAINEANNLGQVAIIDLRGPDPGIAHDVYRSFAVRERLLRDTGTAANHVIWEGQFPVFGDPNYPTEALYAMDRWLSAVERDSSGKPLARKVIDDKPADIHDQCDNGYGTKLLDQLCPAADVPVNGTPRTVAGDALTTDANKCQVKPLDPSAYGLLPLTAAQLTQLRQAFPTGVCDYSRPGVAQQPTIPWLSYSAGPGGRPVGAAPTSTSFAPSAETAAVSSPNTGTNAGSGVAPAALWLAALGAMVRRRRGGIAR